MRQLLLFSALGVMVGLCCYGVHKSNSVSAKNREILRLQKNLIELKYKNDQQSNEVKALTLEKAEVHRRAEEIRRKALLTIKRLNVHSKSMSKEFRALPVDGPSEIVNPLDFTQLIEPSNTDESPRLLID
tara:strand:- start:150 stop:539 length:390 start_codon:yes stop_codon:yes gene_type:complete